MPDARRQTRKIVHGADQDNAKRNPKQAWQPPEGQTRRDWPSNRPRRGYRRKMLTEKVESLRRNKVHVVVDGMGWSNPFVIYPQQAGDPTPIGEIGRGNENYENNGNAREVHFYKGKVRIRMFAELGDKQSSWTRSTGEYNCYRRMEKFGMQAQPQTLKSCLAFGKRFSLHTLLPCGNSIAFCAPSV
jgi:hypothetical protein